MSGANDDRWRPARGQQNPPQNPNRQNNQQQQRRNQSRDGGQGNAWPNSERGNKDSASSGSPPKQSAPVAHSNAQEMRDVLKQAFDSLDPEQAKTARYKAPAGQANSAKSGGPWGTKPNTMGNGKDFFLEIRKQVSALQQSAERAGG